uniref:ATP synthase F0 subunit 8 n=1 Tax=Diploptera punctata TaxID=6984 RepID=UPI0027A790F1|nr:ATP synthase F0 subunit 8 [Diploptera punctata]WGO57213.1 ATP synthase F0 subunit 8 [Diploptera punctata]
MPQMMPLSWLTLFMFFIIMLAIFSFMNYYSSLPSPLYKKMGVSFKMMNWKW